MRTLFAASPLTWTEPSEAFLQALAEAELVKPVCEAQIDVDDFKVPLPVPFAAGDAVHHPFSAYRTVARLGLRAIGRDQGHRR